MDDMRHLGRHHFRLMLYLAQLGRCVWCGKVMSFARRKTGQPARDFATFEHLERKDAGGQMSNDNIVLACRVCNNRRNIEHQARAALGE